MNSLTSTGGRSPSARRVALACALAVSAPLATEPLAGWQQPDPIASWVVFRALAGGQPVLDLAKEDIEIRIDGQPATVGDVEVVGSSQSRLFVVVDEHFMLKLERFMDESVRALLADLADDERVALSSTRPEGVRVRETDNREVILAGVGRLTFGSSSPCHESIDQDGLLGTLRSLVEEAAPAEVPTLVVFAGRHVCNDRFAGNWLAGEAGRTPAFMYVVDVPGVTDAGWNPTARWAADATGAAYVQLAYPNDGAMKRIVRETASYYRVRAEASDAQPFPQYGPVEVAVRRRGVDVRDAGRLRALPPMRSKTPASREAP